MLPIRSLPLTLRTVLRLSGLLLVLLLASRLTADRFSEGEAKYVRARGGKELKLRDAYTAPLERIAGTETFDSLVIDLQDTSDSAFDGVYTFWQEVPLQTGFATDEPAVADINQNGRAELYGQQRFFSSIVDTLHTLVREYESQSGTFPLIYGYADSIACPTSVVGDVDGDGRSEFLQRTWSSDVRLFHTTGPGTLATEDRFSVHPFAGQTDFRNPCFGDFDRDGTGDLAFIGGLNDYSLFVSAYNAALQQMDTVYRFHPPDFYIGGTSIGDFDLDGRTDLVLGSVHGQVYLLECTGARQYQYAWRGDVETFNAYMHTGSQDIDGNGRPEFWVGGDAYYGGFPKTRYTCFEMTGDNQYEPVYRIDLLGIFSMSAGNCTARDIDGDGREELFICLDANVLIFKFTGSPGHPSYKLFYRKHMDDLSPDGYFEYRSATLFDLDGDGKDELVLAMHEADAVSQRGFTRLYCPSGITAVEEPPVRPALPAEFQLFQNYPNPFNASTTIRFVIPPGAGAGTDLSLGVYDITGREVRRLLPLGGLESSGSYSVVWDGKDEAGEAAASGVYLIRLKAGRQTRTIKALMIK